MSDLYTRDGRLHINPFELIANNFTRPAVSREYGMRVSNGSFYETEGRIRFSPEAGNWLESSIFSTVDREEQFLRDTHESELGVDVIVFDKIKVFTEEMIFRNMNLPMLYFTAYGTQNKKSDEGSSKVFMIDGTKGEWRDTKAQYKLTQVSEFCHGNHCVTMEVNKLNSNMSGSMLRLGMITQATSLFYRVLNKNYVFRPHSISQSETNNAITDGGISSCVVNELSYKKRAGSYPDIGYSPKASFHTDKVMVSYLLPKELTKLSDVENKCDPKATSIRNALNCTCRECLIIKTKTKTYHRYMKKNYHSEIESGYSTNWGNTWPLGDYELFKRSIAPITTMNEIQVHDRCMNISAVSGPCALTALCNINNRLLTVGTERAGLIIDLCMAAGLADMSKKAHGLVPRMHRQFLEVICWMLGTRRMSFRKQLKVYRKYVRRLIERLQISRHTFAQAPLFGQRLVRGDKLNTVADRALVSAQAKLPEISSIFKPVGKKFPRQSRRAMGIVASRENDFLRYKQAMSIHNLDEPTELEK